MATELPDEYDDDVANELIRIKCIKTGTIQDEAIEFLLTQQGRLPRVAADIGIPHTTLYDIVSGRRQTMKCAVAEKILRYKMLLGESLLSCQLVRLNVK